MKSLVNREAFTNSTGSLRGLPADHVNGNTAWMDNGPERDDYIAQKNWGFLDYIVLSYATPVAWYSNRDGWHVTEQYHSPTTSKHVHAIRRAINA